MKILYLHAGGSKTGSTAIQNYLELNVDWLRQAGISYENPAGVRTATDVTSGNGKKLFEVLKVADTESAEVDAAILSYFGDFDKAVCSSEYFEQLRSDKWDLFARSAKRLGVQIHLIFYVRNAKPYLSSAYDQIIKYHGEYRDFLEWLQDYRWAHLDFLQHLHAVRQDMICDVRSYDANRSDLIRNFLSTFALAEAGPDKTVAVGVVNRSLTRHERQRMRDINRIFGPVFAKDVSDLLMTAQPHIKAQPYCDDESFSYIRDTYSEGVAWINQEFFEGKDVVKLSSGAKPPSPDHGDDSDARVETILLDWSLRQMTRMASQNTADVVRYLVSTSKFPLPVEKTETTLPFDFDPLAYVLYNADLLSARVEPEQHFLNNGHAEQRVCNFPNRNIGHYVKLVKELQTLLDQKERHIRQLLDIQARMDEVNRVQRDKLASLYDTIVQIYKDEAQSGLSAIDGASRGDRTGFAKGDVNGSQISEVQRLKGIAKLIFDREASGLNH